MKLKTLLLTGLVLMLSAGIIFAATPTDVITDLTGLSDEQVYALHADGKTYGQIAEDNGVLEAYQTAILSEKIDLVKERVADGTLTEAQGDALIERLQANQLNCDPDDPDRIMLGNGMRFGGGNGGNGFGCFDTNEGNGYGNGHMNNRAGGMGFGRFQTNN